MKKGRQRIKIISEFSAQRRSQIPNPALSRALAKLTSINNRELLGRIADLGCGKLRHYKLLNQYAESLYLIDTEKQLSAIHTDAGKKYTIPDVAKNARYAGKKVCVVKASEFEKNKLSLDVVFCIAVFDVVPREIRRKLTKAAAQNLSVRGHFVVIAPRNDYSIIRRCSMQNRYLDGHVFEHHGLHTFYHNFRSHKSIINDCKKEGLYLISDLSLYRQVCLIFGRQECKDNSGPGVKP